MLLKKAKESGYLDAYKKENAEDLSFADRSFDYVFCKESLHHFPRPLLVLYEMLRVSSKGVMLIEPADRATPFGLFGILILTVLNFFTSVAGRGTLQDRFEESGNYLYGISRREIEKVALGMNFKTVAFLGLNGHYLEGVEFERLGNRSPLYRRIKYRIALFDFLYRLRIMECTLLAAIIFKEPPQPQLRIALEGNGYRILDLPADPYLTTEGMRD